MKLPHGDSVGIRELKGRLSAYVDRVRLGESITVTDRGEPVARLVPAAMPEVLVRLAQEGRATLPQRWPPDLGVPRVRLRGRKTAAELVIADRQSRDDAILRAGSSNRSRKRR